MKERRVTVKVSSLVFDWDLYIRPSIDTCIVREMILAEQAGEKFEPIVIDKKSQRVVDGFHRCRKQKRIYGPDATIEAIEKEYPNEAAMLEDAARLNARRGRRLDRASHVRIALLAKKTKLSEDRVASALGVTRDYVQGCLQRTALVGPNGKGKQARTKTGERIALKRTTMHMAGKRLTRNQVVANKKAGGHDAIYYVRQLINLIKADLLNTEDERLMEALGRLRELLETVLVSV